MLMVNKAKSSDDKGISFDYVFFPLLLTNQLISKQINQTKGINRVQKRWKL